MGEKYGDSAYRRSRLCGQPYAIRAASGSERLHEQFNQNFGIWREAESGGAIVFDLIFPRGVQLPEPGQPALRLERTYRPAHNIGHFRYLECSRLDDRGQPIGEITNWEQIQFPFDPRLSSSQDLSAVSVEQMSAGDGVLAREEYTCDANGNVRVKISALPFGKAREYLIGQFTSN